MVIIISLGFAYVTLLVGICLLVDFCVEESDERCFVIQTASECPFQWQNEQILLKLVHNEHLSSQAPPHLIKLDSVSYTHLTLPTNREV